LSSLAFPVAIKKTGAIQVAKTPRVLRGKGAMRETEPSGACEVVIPSETAAARRVQEDIERSLKKHRFDERDIFSVKLAVEEALVNAIKHGNRMDRAKKIRICYCVTPDRLEIDIADEGPGFDPNDVPDPMAIENLERPCGRGLLLIRHYMNEVIFHPPGNRLTMIKKRTPISGHRNGRN
jgi:serine/threonine-protein kinase RsbW